jgi:branched-chain amino acid transport system substrate-binding protein
VGTTTTAPNGEQHVRKLPERTGGVNPCFNEEAVETLLLRIKSSLALLLCLLPVAGCRQDLFPTADGKIHFGVSAPVTGDNAQYARLWRQGFDLALEDIRRQGGVRGREVVLDWEDSESDPKQAVNIAQRFVDDPSILAEMGDFSSPCSMAASPVYQRGGLVQFGFTNSHPDFTKGGSYMFSTSASQEVSARLLLDLAENYSKRTAVLYVNNDWGKSSIDIYVAEAAKHGVEVPVLEGFADSTTDFRPLLLKVRDAGVDVLVIQSYYRSAALIVRQTHQVGLENIKVVWGNYSQEFISLGGAAAEGTSAMQNFYAPDAGPEAQAFVRRFRERFHTDPDYFNVGAYDALLELAWAAGQTPQPTRESIRGTLATAHMIPSVIYGPFSFGPDRRMSHQTYKEMIVRNGAYAPGATLSLAQ